MSKRYLHPWALSPWTYNRSQALSRAGRHCCRTESAWPSSTQNLPVQRPLARRRVIVSQQVIAYYGLIRGSGLLPAAYGCPFADRVFAFAAKAQRFPNLSCVSFCPCRLPYHGDRMASDCCSSIRTAFALFGGARRPPEPTQKSVHAWCAFRGCRVRFMLRPGQLLARHRHRTFTFELSFHESPHKNVEYNYVANSPLPRPDLHRLDTQPYGLRPNLRTSSPNLHLTTCPHSTYRIGGTHAPEPAHLRFIHIWFCLRSPRPRVSASPLPLSRPLPLSPSRPHALWKGCRRHRDISCFTFFLRA